MSQYYISSINKTGSIDGGNETFVYVRDRYDYKFVVELGFNKLVSDKDVEEYVYYMNYPLYTREKILFGNFYNEIKTNKSK